MNIEKMEEVSCRYADSVLHRVRDMRCEIPAAASILLATAMRLILATMMSCVEEAQRDAWVGGLVVDIEKELRRVLQEGNGECDAKTNQ
jgi:hypothetical protein